MSEYIDSKDAMRPQDIRWETVKTEEEEYLDKLQSKLTRVMDGFHPTPPKATDDTLDSDEISDVMRVSRPLSQAQDHDEGVHLMYNYLHSAAIHNSNTTSISPQPFPSSSQAPNISDVPPDGDIILPSSRQQRSVRFRSRVRITSGVHSVSSSCGSRSSSISMPLQGPHGPNVSKSTAPLSGDDMLSSETANSSLTHISSPRKRRTHNQREPRRNSVSPRSSPLDERTPLAASSHTGSRRSYTEYFEDEEEEDEDAELDRLRAAARKSEEQVMFGKWPWRLLSRHWWWWKIEPVVCCCSYLDEESDLE